MPDYNSFTNYSLPKSTSDICVKDPYYKCGICNIGFKLEHITRLVCGHFTHNICYKRALQVPTRCLICNSNIQACIKKVRSAPIFSTNNIINKNLTKLR